MDAKEKRVKRLLYQSFYRGCKETDKIIGGYVKQNIHALDDKAIDDLEELLKEEDIDIYDWLSNKKPTPERILANKIFVKLKDFRPSENIG